MNLSDASESGLRPHPRAQLEVSAPESSPLRLVPPLTEGLGTRQRSPGRELSFDDLYRRHFDEVYRNLALLGVPACTREDATQDVFVVVHRRLDDFEGRSSARTWILAIARRVASRHRRTGFREWRRRQAFALEPDDSFCSLDGVIENREAAEILEAFLATLDVRLREAFVLGAVQGLGRKEMGEVMGVSPNTAYSRLRLARTRFKERALPPAAQRELLAAWRKRKEDPALRSRMLAVFPAWLGGAGVAVGHSSLASKAIILAAALLLSFGTTRLLAGSDDPQEPKAPHIAQRSSSAFSDSNGVRPHPVALPNHSLSDQRPSQRGVSDETPRAREPLKPARESASTPPQTRVGTFAQPKADEAILQAEVAILQDAQAAVEADDRPGAMAALEAHRRAFPKGRLAVDRDFMLSSFACKDLPLKDKAAIARAFERKYPATPQAIRLRTRCASRADEIQRPSL